MNSIVIPSYIWVNLFLWSAQLTITAEDLKNTPSEKTQEGNIPCLAATESGEKGWGKKIYFWDKKIVTFNFIDLQASASLKDRVEQSALQWNGIANITLKRISDSEVADVRVSFGSQGHWSKIGNTALRVPKIDCTMNLSLLDSTEGKEIRRVTLHEFGHALGLMHEHQMPNVPIKWNEKAVYAYYAGKPNYWNEDQVKKEVLSNYPAEGTLTVGFDATSVMLYPIVPGLAENFRSKLNFDLSESDRKFLKAAYP